MGSINITASVANLPLGWKDTPQAFAQWLVENMSFEATGEFLTGQIGGAEPTVDVGIFIDGKKVKVWNGTKYVLIDTVPIGAMLMWASNSVTPPEGYLFCQGQLLNRVDYPDLFTAIGTTWTGTGDPGTQFRLPDGRGRVGVGSGLGDYNPTGNTVDPKKTGSGKITERVTGEYYGFEWGTYKQTTQPNAPTPRYIIVPYLNAPSNRTFYYGVSEPSFCAQWIIRAT